MKRTFLNRKSGFTLIEIIIVVVILGILAAVALPRLSENINKSKAAEAFQIGSAVARAFDRCLSQESGGGIPNTANVTACNTSGEMNLATPSTANFTYTIGSGATTTNLEFTAVLKGGAAGDFINFTFNGTDGSLVRTCGSNIFQKMCK